MNMIDFKTLEAGTDGLVPAIVQDQNTLQVLMLGYMNAEALEKTQSSGFVTFFSRSRQTLWTKGETSGNYLHLVSIAADCDSDTLLVRVVPDGPACHKGTKTCWGDAVPTSQGFIRELESVIRSPTPRLSSRPEPREWPRKSVRRLSRPSSRL